MHFHIHNGSRDVTTRFQRAKNATHGGLKQYIMNGTRRLVRGRPVAVTEDLLKQHIEELRALEKSGVLYVTTTDGRPVNLYDAALPVAPAAPVVNSTPNAPLDSADNDLPRGVQMNTFNQEAPPPKDFQMPVAPPVAAVENPVVPSEAVTPVEGVPAVTEPALSEPSVEVTAEPVAPVVEVKAEEPAAEPTVETPAAAASAAEVAPGAEAAVAMDGATKDETPDAKKSKKDKKGR